MPEPTTTRGRGTRERILAGAARMFHARGVRATSVDDVLAAAGAGKGQFYRYFASKDELAAAVVERQLDRYLEPQRERLERLESWTELEEYTHDLVAGHRERGLVGGCPIGSLALELAGQDAALRRRLAGALEAWEQSLAVALRRLAAHHEMRADAEPERAAASLLAAVQGAYLLSTVRDDERVMREALDATLAALRAGAPREARPTPGGTA